MGMYTELVIKTTLKSGLSKEVMDVIDYLFGNSDKPTTLPDHEFFKDIRWSSVGHGCSFYHHPKPVNSIWKDTLIKGTDWYIFSRSDLKNYTNTIEKFVDWFMPLTEAYYGECIGYTWYEEAEIPTLIIMKDYD